MLPTRWTPFERWLTIPGLLEDAFAAWPAWSNVQETEEGYKIQEALPGFKPDEVEVTLVEGTLRITASHREQSEAHDGMRSAFARSVDRRFTLPEGVQPEDVSANLEDGILTVTVRRTDRNRKRIPVTAGQPQLAGGTAS